MSQQNCWGFNHDSDQSVRQILCVLSIVCCSKGDRQLFSLNANNVRDTMTTLANLICITAWTTHVIDQKIDYFVLGVRMSLKSTWSCLNVSSLTLSNVLNFTNEFYQRIVKTFKDLGKDDICSIIDCNFYAYCHTCIFYLIIHVLNQQRNCLMINILHYAMQISCSIIKYKTTPQSCKDQEQIHMVGFCEYFFSSEWWHPQNQHSTINNDQWI